MLLSKKTYNYSFVIFLITIIFLIVFRSLILKDSVFDFYGRFKWDSGLYSKVAQKPFEYFSDRKLDTYYVNKVLPSLIIHPIYKVLLLLNFEPYYTLNLSFLLLSTLSLTFSLIFIKKIIDYFSKNYLLNLIILVFIGFAPFSVFMTGFYPGLFDNFILLLSTLMIYYSFVKNITVIKLFIYFLGSFSWPVFSLVFLPCFISGLNKLPQIQIEKFMDNKKSINFFLIFYLFLSIIIFYILNKIGKLESSIGAGSLKKNVYIIIPALVINFLIIHVLLFGLIKTILHNVFINLRIYVTSLIYPFVIFVIIFFIKKLNIFLFADTSIQSTLTITQFFGRTISSLSIFPFHFLSSHNLYFGISFSLFIILLFQFILRHQIEVKLLIFLTLNLLFITISESRSFIHFFPIFIFYIFYFLKESKIDFRLSKTSSILLLILLLINLYFSKIFYKIFPENLTNLEKSKYIPQKAFDLNGLFMSNSAVYISFFYFVFTIYVLIRIFNIKIKNNS